MKLKKISLLAMYAVCIILLRNVFFTFFQYSSGYTALADLILSFLSEAVLIVFFLTYIRSSINIDDNQLMNASIGVVTISTGVLVINLITRLGVYLDSYWQADKTLEYIYILVNWLRSIIIAYFFFSFYIANSQKSDKLRKTAVIGFTGAAATMIMQSVKLLNYFYYIRLGYAFIGKQSIIHLPLGLLLILTSVFGWFYFFGTLRKGLPEN